MAFVHGKNTAIWLGAIDLSGYLNSLELSMDSDVAETTTFGTTWKSGLTGTAGAKLDYEGFYDPLELQLGELLAAGTQKALTYAPGGAAAIGDGARLLNCYEVAFGQSAPVGDIVAVKGSFFVDNVVGYADVLHPLSEDTNNTTGAIKTDAAATTTGWTAHLHVTAVDGGSWVIKLTDSAAADFSSGADVTGGAFTAATTATSQRLTGASGATLRRYVRYVATRTGGSAGDGITFALAYSRN